MQLQVKTLLNAIQHFPGFVFEAIRLHRRQDGPPERIEITVAPQAGRPARCARCRRPAPGDDRLAERCGRFVPLWGMVTWFLHAARRVNGPEHGVVVEPVPWSEGKRPGTMARRCFLARWARRLSWREPARASGTSWEGVDRSVEWFVAGGLAHRKREPVWSMGMDESHWGKSKRADGFLTVSGQIDGHCRRLLRVGKRRTPATLRQGLAALGAAVVGGLRFVGSDRWRPCLNVMADRAGQALPVRDRFPITMHLNQAADQVRRAESGRLRAKASGQVARLKDMRWKRRRRGRRVRGKARAQLHALAASKLATARAWRLKETCQPFWRYRSLTGAGYFPSVWTERARRSRLEPMKKVARRRHAHQGRRRNWFKAKGEIASGTGEGLNNKIRVVTRRA